MKHPVVVMMMQTERKTTLGYDINMTCEEEGLIGMMPVYESKKAARKIWGRKVMLAKVSMSIKEGA